MSASFKNPNETPSPLTPVRNQTMRIVSTVPHPCHLTAFRSCETLSVLSIYITDYGLAIADRHPEGSAPGNGRRFHVQVPDLPDGASKFTQLARPYVEQAQHSEGLRLPVLLATIRLQASPERTHNDAPQHGAVAVV